MRAYAECHRSNYHSKQGCNVEWGEPQYTREYSFNSATKNATNDSILNDPGVWNPDRSTSFIQTFNALSKEIKDGTKLGTASSSIGTPKSSWTINTSDENYVSIPKITSDHPRLLLTADNIPTIRKALEESTPTNERFFELLDKPSTYINNGKLASPETNFDGRTGLHNYRKDYLEFIQIKALGYLVDGHKLYGYQAIHCMKQFLLTLDIQHIGSNVEREYGNVMFTAALVYDWCYPLLSADDKNQLIAGVENRTASGTMGDGTGKKMHAGFPPFSSVAIGAVVGHGSERELLRDYLSASIAFYGDNNSWWNYVSKLLYSQYVPVRNYYFQSGVSHQGLGVYVSGRHISDMYSAWLLLTATGSQPYKNIHTTIRNLLGYECAPGKLFSDGDGSMREQNNYELRAMAYMTAYMFEDEAMLAQARSMQSNKAFGADTIELTSAMYVALTGMSDITPGADRYEGMPLIQYNGMPAGQYITHEAYNDASSANVFMRIKGRYTANHEHLDAGTFMIYYKGMLTADGGAYSGYGSDHQRYYHQATVAHNGLLIFDESKLDKSSDVAAEKWYSGGQEWLAGPTDYASLKSDTYLAGSIVGRGHGYTDSTNTTPLYAYIGGNITASYPSDTVSHVGRRMLTAYTGDEDVPMVFFTYDTITATKGSFKKTYLLQIPSSEAPIINKTNKTVKTENGDGQLVLTCLTDGMDIEGVGGGTGKNYQINGVQNESSHDTKSWGRVELSVSGASSHKLLNAIYVTDRGNETYYETVPITNVSMNTLSGGDVEGAVFNNSIAAIFTKRNLNSSSNYIAGTISFTTSGNSTMRYYVDGLQGGNWQISVGGKFVTIAKATNGLLTFEAPAGDVKIVKEADELTSKKTDYLNALGEKISNASGIYTESSYAEYCEAYDAAVLQINSATTAEVLGKIDPVKLRSEAEAKLVKAQIDFISVDVEWTDISFAYSDSSRTWNPNEHNYDTGNDSGWNDSAGEITVTNSSNVEIDVSITYNKPSSQNGTAVLNVDKSQFSLGISEKYTANITATGVPTDNSGIGSLTVKVEKKSG